MFSDGTLRVLSKISIYWTPVFTNTLYVISQKGLHMPDTARCHRASTKSTQLADIAERTGYSLATVSKVLNGRSDVAAGTRRIIEEALRDSGYTKRISTTKNRKLIEAVFQNFDNIWSLEVLRGIVREASAHDMSVITTESGDRTHRTPNGSTACCAGSRSAWC